MYFTSYGVQAPFPSEDPGDGKRPIGALALAATAVCCCPIRGKPLLTLLQVERGYFLHRTGDYLSSSNEFSTTNWLRTTNMYLDKIQNDLTSDNWSAIFKALHQLEDSCARAAQVEAGVTAPEDREPLLPADPPTPPPV
jgi:hypothetical protein